MKTQTSLLLVIAAALLGVSFQTNGATWTGPYTKGAVANPLTNATANVLFVDNAALGGSDLLAVNGNPGFVVQSVNLWNAGDTVTLTGMALPLRTLTTNGTFTITFYDLNGGANADTFDGTNNNVETLVGTTTVTLSADIAVATNLYAIFDSPITFTARSTGIATRFVNSAGVTWKITTASPAPNCVRYVTTTGGANGGANPSFALTLAGTATPPTTTATWTGNSGTSWATAGNWSPSALPATSGNTVLFNSSSTANLATVLNQNFNVAGVAVTSPSGAVSIGGANTLTVTNGINLFSATADLTITAPVVLGASQSWSVRSNQTLSVNGGISGNFPLSFEGTGTNSLGGAGTYSGNTGVGLGAILRMGADNVLPNGAGVAGVVVNGTLDLNGKTEAINNLSGSGSVDNLSGGAGVLSIGNSNDVITTSGLLLKNTSGTLALVKNGNGGLTLTGANTFSGGFTNNGTGSISSGNATGTNFCFGTGPVVMNAGTIYMTTTNWTFTNALTLNGATLRVGGGASHFLNWSGPVNVTADSFLGADGSTAGIILSGGLTMSNNSTLTNFGAGGPIVISNSISGASGTIISGVASVFFNLYAANTFGGTFRAANGTLKIFDALAMQNATLDMNAADLGAVSLNNLSATIGALTGSRDLFLGNAVISIGNNNANTIYSGGLSGTASLTKIGTGTLTLGGASTYSGKTTISVGTLLVNNTSGSGLGTNFVTINSGGTLGGTGSISGIVTNNAGGTLSPGASIGTLTVNSNLVLNAGSTNVFEVNGSTPTNDVVALGSGSVTYGGVLKIVPTGSFIVGQTFKLFSGTGATNTGNFASILVSPAGSTFSFTNGTLTVLTTGAVAQPLLTNSVSGNTLTLSWPAGQGFRLQQQTNALTTGLSTNWVNLTDASVSSTNITINSTLPTVFYRLINP